MPSLKIGGISIEFPHEPYNCQVEYMQRLLSALSNAQHAILESPTGTGKTLCLLCTSLAWLDSFITKSSARADAFSEEVNPFLEVKVHDLRPNTTKVIFASRTHSQLAQAVNVLKQTAYANRNVSVIGSRDQLCLLPEVTALESNSAKIFACRARVQTRTCDYYRNFDAKRDNLVNTLKADGVVDIEDIVALGKSTRCCPYYMSRELKANADMIFMPYNYLLDPKIRRLYNIELENAVVIFDEAHNIEQVCEDAASVSLSSSVLASAIEYLRVVCEVVFNLTAQTEADEASERGTSGSAADLLATYDITRAGEDKLSSLSLEKLLLLKGQLIELERLIDALDIPEAGLTKTSEFILDLLGRAGITSQTKEMALQTIEEILSVSAAAENLKIRKPKGISEVSEFLKTFFDSKGLRASSLLFPFMDSAGPDFSRCYRLYIKDEAIHNRNRAATEDRVWDSRGPSRTPVVDRTLSYWCLSPGRAMQDLIRERVRCVILTSGTLYPVEPIEAELRMSFAVQLKNPHVIDSDQVRVAILTRGSDGQQLNSTYAIRERLEFRNSLGLTLLDIMPIVPAGLLVFFPSYSMMAQCMDTWKNGQLYDRMLRYKRIFVEPRDKVQFSKVFADYRNSAALRSPSDGDVDGAALFAVMRGRASEGMDLADYAGRGVAVLGLPYPPFMDPRVKLKMAYLDEQHTELMNNRSQKATNGPQIPVASHPTGRKWYNIQAWRTVNQSVGRVIRHHRDFGAVFLCDERFASAVSKSELPAWMHSSLRVYNEVTSAIKETSVFYKDALIKYAPQGPENQNNRPSSSVRPNLLNKPFQMLPDTSGKSLKRLLEMVPRANQVEIFAQSFAPSALPSSDSLLSTYASLATPASGTHIQVDSSENKLSGLSLFESIETTPSDIVSSTPVTDGHEQTDDTDEDLASRLLRSSSTKRLRLSHSASHSDSPVARFSDAVKLYFQQQQHHTPSQGRQCVQRLKQALQAYRTESNAISQPNSTVADPNACVDALFKELASLFQADEAQVLLKSASCFLHSTHQTRFAELYDRLASERLKKNARSTTVKSDASQPDLKLMCSKCNLKPAQTPLISTCQHIACFSCWRSVIEEGNRRCPSCHTLVRRRNLTRLVLSNTSITEMAGTT